MPTSVDLYAFGSRAGPRAPRRGVDYTVDANGMVGPQQPPFPKGASLFADASAAPLTGHYHRLPAGHIDTEIGKWLRREEYDDYWMFLELLAELDIERARALAGRAAEHCDPEIRELGLEKLADFSQRHPEGPAL